MVAQYDFLRRPTALLSSLSTFDADVRKATGDAVAFDALVGRNILADRNDKVAGRRQSARHYRPNRLRYSCGNGPLAGTAALCIAPIRRFGPYMCASIGGGGESLFAIRTDPLVNWTPEFLGMLGGVFLRVSKPNRGKRPAQAHIPDQIDHWFRPSAKNERESLGARFGEQFGSASRPSYESSCTRNLTTLRSLGERSRHS